MAALFVKLLLQRLRAYGGNSCCSATRHAKHKARTAPTSSVANLATPVPAPPSTRFI